MAESEGRGHETVTIRVFELGAPDSALPRVSEGLGGKGSIPSPMGLIGHQGRSLTVIGQHEWLAITSAVMIMRTDTDDRAVLVFDHPLSFHPPGWLRAVARE